MIFEPRKKRLSGTDYSVNNRIKGNQRKESSIRLNLQFNKFEKASLESKLLSEQPYLYIYFTECSDLEIYKNELKDRLIFFLESNAYEQIGCSTICS